MTAPRAAPGAESRAFLGRGWAFPLAQDDTGGVALTADEDDIRAAVRIILGTSGDRAMRPDFGANLKALVFEPLNQTTFALIRHRVEEALILWEPRIDTIEVEVRGTPALGRVDIGVGYRVRSTNTFYNLVYPFYLLEGRRE